MGKEKPGEDWRIGWERRTPERREERTGKGETRREVRKEQGKEKPREKVMKTHRKEKPKDKGNARVGEARR
jgi:hypothetical protein